MKHENLLITGGAGFVGSNLAVSFKRKYPRTNVIVLDNLKRRGSELNLVRLKENGINFIHGDIRNPEDLNLGNKIDLMIECSAEPSVLAGYSQNPLYVINTNLTGTINCLELARKNNAGVIFLSTSRVYAYDALNSIKTEENEKRLDWQSGQQIKGWSMNGIDTDFSIDTAKTLYGATKLASEIILQEYIGAYNLKGVVNRCGVIAGPWQFGKVDQGVFTFWMLAHYFKQDLNYIGFEGRGKQVRDLLHIDDLFELVDIQASNLERVNGRVYNVGGGRQISLSLLETTEACERISGNKIKIGSDLKNRLGDIKIYITDNKKISDELGWVPKKTTTDILNDIFSWIRENEQQLKKSLQI